MQRASLVVSLLTLIGLFFVYSKFNNEQLEVSHWIRTVSGDSTSATPVTSPDAGTAAVNPAPAEVKQDGSGRKYDRAARLFLARINGDGDCGNPPNKNAAKAGSDTPPRADTSVPVTGAEKGVGKKEDTALLQRAQRAVRADTELKAALEDLRCKKEK